MSTTPNTNETGAQFAAQQHLQTVKAQESIIHAQQLELERALQRVGQLEEALRLAGLGRTSVDSAVKAVGAKMASMMFNLAQDESEVPSKSMRNHMKEMQVEWDRTIASTAATPAPIKERRRFEERG